MTEVGAGPLLTVKGLHAWYGEAHILHGGDTAAPRARAWSPAP